MQRVMLKSKIHRARITATELDYAGSITVDEALLDRADILPGEQVHVLNVNTGDRFVTYAIPAAKGSHAVILNGPAARLGQTGDEVIVLSYCTMDARESHEHRPRVLFVDEHNEIRETHEHVPVT